MLANWAKVEKSQTIIELGTIRFFARGRQQAGNMV
jgi:hypothetical protein